MRVVGIDPGTVSIDLCGLDDGELVLDRSIPTERALADPQDFARQLKEAKPDLVAGPSGYGLPLTRVADADDRAIRLAYLAAAGERGGIGGLRALALALAEAELPVLFTPGVIHLPSVPAHRKVNRVDLGTADKVCAAALGIHEQVLRRGCAIGEVSFVLLEIGGAFSAAIAVNGGQIVDGMGGTSGPLGMRASGALDGEVAFLAGHVPKGMLFRGGATTIAGERALSPERFGEPATPRERLAWNAFMESAVKAVATMCAIVPHPREILLSGRLVHVEPLARELHLRLSPYGDVHRLQGFATTAKEAAQGAALIADGLAGGRHQALTDSLGIREARGTALDHLYVISPADALRRLGLR
ncbi:MAG TPA: DUF1464 family protein [Gemmatimonadaceae bacterium]|nr:DUF1464 family protein [Gemmatimonadaceae bacterium]